MRAPPSKQPITIAIEVVQLRHLDPFGQKTAGEACREGTDQLGEQWPPRYAVTVRGSHRLGSLVSPQEADRA